MMTRRGVIENARAHTTMSSLHPIYEDKMSKPILSWMPSQFSLHVLPKLEKRDAVHVREASQETTKNKKHYENNTYMPDYTIIDNYASYPYIKYSKIVNDKYIDNQTNELNIEIPEVITDLCYKYLFSEKDSVFQLAYNTSKILSTNNKNESRKVDTKNKTKTN
eukprot:886972_1